jgi:hypothetical protein
LGAPANWFWTTFFIASGFVINQQIATGKLNQPHHFYGSMLQPFTMVFALQVLLLGFFRERWAGPATLRGAVAGVFVAAGIGVVVWRSEVAAKPAGYTSIDGDLRQLTDAMQAPSLADFGFVTNDGYLDVVLPAYVPEKPLNPWYMDPLTNAEIASLRAGLLRTIDQTYPGLFGSSIPAHLREPRASSRIADSEFDQARVLLVVNRAGLQDFRFPPCAVVMENNSFVVGKLQCNVTARK